MGYIFWDPSREMFSCPLPLIGRPILWYGFFFALGFFLGYLLFVYLLKKNKIPQKPLADRVLLYVLVGAVIGARLGDLLFYQKFSAILHDPLLVVRVWEGGLASHGALVGILIALYILSKRRSSLSWVKLLDLTVIPGCVGGAFIRIGNFFNQEILGKETSVPWAVIFGHPADGSLPAPRHPVQLYEALFYFFLAAFLLYLWRFVPFYKKEGKISGLFFVLLFVFRFFIEFFKEEQSALLSSSSLFTMGQLLSLPLILFGLYLLRRR